MTFPPFSKILVAAVFETENEQSVILCLMSPVPNTLPGKIIVSASLVN
jgi:hypothetical protein